MTIHRQGITLALIVVVLSTGLLSGNGVLGSKAQDQAVSQSSGNIARYAGPSLDLGPDSEPSAPPPAKNVATVAGRSLTNPCWNSWDRPKCGDAHWDPPVNNLPAGLSVEINPPMPREGEEVTFTFTWSDDADVPLFAFCSGYSGCVDVGAVTSCPASPTGPWSPPPVRMGNGRIVQKVVYAESGTFEWKADLETESSSYAELARRHPCLDLPDPFASAAGLQQPIVVVPPSWPHEPLRNDLAFVKMRSTGGPTVEVHSLSAASSYQTQRSSPTALPQPADDEGTFQLINMNSQRRAEMVYLQTSNTYSGSVEVNLLLPGSGQTANWESATSDLPATAHDDGFLEMADMDGDGRPELVFIQTRNTRSGRTEVHWYRASSGYRTQRTATTAFGFSDARNGTFEMSDMDGDERLDLVFIKSRDTGSGHIELHWLSAASGYQSKVSAVTKFSAAEDGNGQFSMIDEDGF